MSLATVPWDDWDDEECASAGVLVPTPAFEPSSYSGWHSESGAVSIGGVAFDAETCVALHCSHCGHDVTRFSGCAWAESVDYYWFRNYAPDPRMPERREEDIAKLSAKLVSGAAIRLAGEGAPAARCDVASAALCCGCSWQTVSDAKRLHTAGTPAAPHGGARLDGDGLVRWVVRTVNPQAAPATTAVAQVSRHQSLNLVGIEAEDLQLGTPIAEGEFADAHTTRGHAAGTA